MNCENPEEVITGLQFVLIELPKLTPESLIEKKMAVLWLRFLKEINDQHSLVPPKELDKNIYIHQALKLCEEGAFTDEERASYEKSWDIIRTENAVRYTERKEGMEEGMEKGMKKGLAEGMEKGLAEGMEKGIEKGLAEGMEKGMEKGIEKGLAEGMKKGLEHVVINSFKSGLSLEAISSITALTSDEVIAILKAHDINL
jgi:flagellar biosynthesis/type III secretory pathway protein FliH